MNRFAAQAEYVDEHFKAIECQREQISSEFTDCLFSDCTFRETLFKNCRFHECVFSNCDLSLASVEGSSFSNTRFEKSRVIGINWTLASWPKYPLRPPIHFDECVLDYSTFIGLSLPGIRITGCRAKDVDFSEADLSEADFSKTDLSESRFGQTNLTKANFEDATNYTIDVHLNDVSKARFSLPEAVSLLRSLDIVLVE